VDLDVERKRKIRTSGIVALPILGFEFDNWRTRILEKQ
jgi:hypothetical protein